MNGFNAACFAYGQTGAGKTHTMIGNHYSHMSEPGLTLLALNDIFSRLKEDRTHFSVKISLYEIYNERVIDLLSDRLQNILIVDDPSRGTVLSGISEYEVEDNLKAAALIHEGNSKRIVAQTEKNHVSTRSHAILQISIEKRLKTRNIIEEVSSSKLYLIDLAGSERITASENKGLRTIEGGNINRSLLALANCINILSDSKKKGKFVPYRDSKLTRILKEALGGNTKTIMVACISPSLAHIDETLNTLKYADKARYITNKTRPNIIEVEAHVSEYKEIITSLRNEVEYLNNQLKNEENNPNLVKEFSMNASTEDIEIESKFQTETYDTLQNHLLANFEEH